ncbi:ABC transporter ATP-binding protein [Brachybacterium alimentarium]|uniref:ABC transporter ATP-binding protein n=1 Tax=Brachybacterium alimentarium TaxID=47845 RepID=UPI000DF1F026|nr:ATP-binding cassette domain-containing protein [Brachybacterium alimentarium]RCS79821.1 ATP-binding cassette domain-containing protein [Brachybacterium alimentarium]
MTLLDVHGLSVRYKSQKILTNVSFEINAGESLAITGRSGTGKSSLLAALLGMVRPASGSMTIDGHDVGSLRGARRNDYLRKSVSVVFQHGELIDELEPIENVAIPALLAGTPRDQAMHHAHDLLTQLEVPQTGVTTRLLSGGEQQRVAVARALVTRPKLILADEPTGALDVEFQEIVGDLILSIPDRWGAALLLVTHDMALARRADSSFALVAHDVQGSQLEALA